MKFESALVTGSNSFIGKNLVKELENLGVKVQTQTKEDVFNGKEIYPCDVVYNLAAAGSKKGAYTRQDLFDTNIAQAFNLLEWARENAGMFVQFSTSSVYGRKAHPMEVGMKLEPNFLYAATKAATEQLVREWSVYTGNKAIVVRPFSIYGEGMQETKLIPTVIRQLKSGDPISIVDGEHDYLHIEDLVRGVLTVTETVDNGLTELNFGTGKAFTNQEVVEIIADILHVRPDIQVIKELEWHGHFKLDSDVWRANISLTKQYGWSPKIPFEQGLRRMING